jgi:hypothetical protein
MDEQRGPSSFFFLFPSFPSSPTVMELIDVVYISVFIANSMPILRETNIFRTNSVNMLNI